MTDSQTLLLDHFYGLLAADAELTALGVTKSSMSRRYGVEEKDPDTPRLTFAVDQDGRQTFANIDYVRVFVTCSSKKMQETSLMSVRVAKTLHLHKAATPELVVYSCFALGGPAQPMHNKESNTWEAIVEIETRFAVVE